MAGTLECYSCGTRETFPTRRCSCGEPLWFVYPDSTDPGAPGAGVGMWASGAPLPASRPGGFPGAVGNTPMYRADGVVNGTGSVLIKDETVNPTGSFKDRGTAVGAAWAVDRGMERIGTVSHGNMARSIAATGAALALEAVVLVPADIPQDRLGHIGVYGPTLVRVDGDYGSLYEQSYGLESTIEGLFVNSDDPLRIAGQKTIAVEIMAQSDPDAIVLPVSSGGNASAVWKGLRELRRADRIETFPRLYLVQAAACSPIADAYRAGRSRVDPVDPDETVAYSIANADPPSGTRALAAVEATDGAVVSVADDEIVDAQRRLSRRAGRRVEPASSTTLAGLESLLRSGDVDRDETVVLVMTGTGLLASTTEPAEPSAVSLDSLPARLPGFVAD